VEVCVVPDTNIWVYASRLLRTPIGAALLYAVRTSEATIGLPEVIERELLKHAEKLGGNLLDKATDAHRQLVTLLGQLGEFPAPKRTFEAAAVDRLTDLDSLILRVPVRCEHSEAALDRILRELPPNGPRDQQFKDCMVWEAVLELADERDVHLITEDAGFYEGRKYANGLAASLQEQAAAAGKTISIHRDISTFLEHFRSKVPAIDYDAVARNLAVALQPELARIAERHPVSIGDLREHHIVAFITERIDSVAMKFDMIFPAEHGEQTADRRDAVVTVSGEASCKLPDLSVTALQVERIGIQTGTGEPLPGGSVRVLLGTAYLGQRTIKHELRHPLDEI